MFDSFQQYVRKFDDWVMEGSYQGVKEETRDFIENIMDQRRDTRLWRLQERALLRVICCYEILGKKNVLLNIVTGGGKTAIIAAVMAWLRLAHGVRKFLIIVPNLIVRDRLEDDFKDGRVFRRFQLFPKEREQLINDLELAVLGSGSGPQDIVSSGIILGNIQQFYSTNISGKRHLASIMNFVGDLVVFNDEAHNTPAPEYSNVLSTISPKARFRLDTTATPDRADGQTPDSEMIFYYSISNALEDQIIKSIVVYEPQVKLVELTYTNYETGERKVVTELDPEFERAERGIEEFHWILDPEPMKKQMAIALQRIDEQKLRAKGRYKPLLFVVTMSIKEAERAQKILEDTFKVKTLLVTEESDEKDREEARRIGSLKSPYDAVVSVLMLREGWDVPEVSTILLLRKFSSPVYGQQVIGRGLRRIVRDDPEPEILAVVDHPKLQHDWLWQLVAVSKIRQGVGPEDRFGDEDLPTKLKIQKLVKPENFIVIPEPEYETKIDFKKIADRIPKDEIEQNWRRLLEAITYERDAWMITRTKVEQIKRRRLQDRRVEILQPSVNSSDQNVVEEREKTLSELKEDLKSEVLDLASGLLVEAGFGGLRKGELYNAMMDHISWKIFNGKPLTDAESNDVEFAIFSMPQIRKNFTPKIIAGILKG